MRYSSGFQITRRNKVGLRETRNRRQERAKKLAIWGKMKRTRTILSTEAMLPWWLRSAIKPFHIVSLIPEKTIAYTRKYIIYTLTISTLLKPADISLFVSLEEDHPFGVRSPLAAPECCVLNTMTSVWMAAASADHKPPAMTGRQVSKICGWLTSHQLFRFSSLGWFYFRSWLVVVQHLHNGPKVQM